MSEAPQKKGTSWSIGIGLGIVALLIGTAIVTEPSVSFSSSGNRGCAPAGTETPLRLQTNTLSISAPGWRTLRRNWNRPAWMFLRSRRKP